MTWHDFSVVVIHTDFRYGILELVVYVYCDHIGLLLVNLIYSLILIQAVIKSKHTANILYTYIVLDRNGQRNRSFSLHIHSLQLRFVFAFAILLLLLHHLKYGIGFDCHQVFLEMFCWFFSFVGNFEQNHFDKIHNLTKRRKSIPNLRCLLKYFFSFCVVCFCCFTFLFIVCYFCFVFYIVK